MTGTAWFVVGAIFINVLTYGGIAWGYFAEQRRQDRTAAQQPRRISRPSTLGAGRAASAEPLRGAA